MQTSRSIISRPVGLVILDGWGYAPRTGGNAIAIANTPYYNEICRKYPMTTLAAAGSDIGQPAGAAGSVELGHLNLGSGRVARTETERIRIAMASGEFAENAVMKRAFARARVLGSAVHFIGLVSDGGVHSSTEHLFALMRLAKSHRLDNVFIHGILDGVDVPPRTADIYVEALEIKLADIGIGKIASLCGRFFAMDASENWERTARAFTMLVHGEGEPSSDAVSAVRNSFLRGIADEFIAPIIIQDSSGAAVARVRDGDLVVFFNHRPETMRQLARSLCVPEGPSGTKPSVDTVCLTEYDAAFNLPAAFRHEGEKNTLVEALARAEIPAIKVTENSRLSHLTYFFDGGADLSGVDQQIVITGAGPRGEYPESHSFKIVDALRRAVDTEPHGVYVVNLPATDMAADTGDLDKTIAAVQYMDTCLGGICEKFRSISGSLLITSSHGHCEEMIDPESGEPNAAVTANPVPLHFVDDAATGARLIDGGSLRDVAPTLLGMVNVEKPEEMTGADLRCL